MEDFQGHIELGATGLKTRRLGIGADTGIPAAALEWAFEQGVNYFYWGTSRTAGMKEAIRHLAPRHRDDMIIALQSYDITGLGMNYAFHRGLRQLGIDYADVLILGKRDSPVSPRIQDKVRALKEAGLVRYVCVSAHDRKQYAAHLATGLFDLFMVRYNCAHPGAETEVFPLLDGASPKPGVLVYNSTRWGHLFDPKWTPDGEATPEPTHLYRHALSHPAVDMVLMAPSTKEQLADNLRALEQGPLDEYERAWLSRIGKHVHASNPSSNWDFLFQSRFRPQ